jgi:hypothetical protein
MCVSVPNCRYVTSLTGFHGSNVKSAGEHLTKVLRSHESVSNVLKAKKARTYEIYTQRKEG